MLKQIKNKDTKISAILLASSIAVPVFYAIISRLIRNFISSIWFAFLKISIIFVIAYFILTILSLVFSIKGLIGYVKNHSIGSRNLSIVLIVISGFITLTSAFLLLLGAGMARGMM